MKKKRVMLIMLVILLSVTVLSGNRFFPIYEAKGKVTCNHGQPIRNTVVWFTQTVGNHITWVEATFTDDNGDFSMWMHGGRSGEFRAVSQIKPVSSTNKVVNFRANFCP